MALIDFNLPLLLNGEPAYNVGHGTYPNGIVYYVSTGIPPVVYPYNELGSPINDPYFVNLGYPVSTHLLTNTDPECPCITPNPESLLNDPLVKDLYITQWDGVYSLASLEDIRFGYDVVHTLPQSILHLRLSISGETGVINNIDVSELLNVEQTIQDFYSLGDVPITPDNHFYDDSLIYG